MLDPDIAAWLVTEVLPQLAYSGPGHGPQRAALQASLERHDRAIEQLTAIAQTAAPTA